MLEWVAAVDADGFCWIVWTIFIFLLFSICKHICHFLFLNASKSCYTRDFYSCVLLHVRFDVIINGIIPAYKYFFRFANKMQIRNMVFVQQMLGAFSFILLISKVQPSFSYAAKLSTWHSHFSISIKISF